jgi:hypothetical protein
MMLEAEAEAEAEAETKTKTESTSPTLNPKHLSSMISVTSNN